MGQGKISHRREEGGQGRQLCGGAPLAQLELRDLGEVRRTARPH